MWWSVLVCGLIGRVVGDVVAPWWTNAVYYRVLVDSFRDGDGDGLGDLKGVIKQISYIKALGADAVILSPLVARSTDCSQPGTMDFTQIDERYGNDGNFNDLVEKAKKLELKLVVTLPLQTVSSGSEWFTSSAERTTGFEDRIVWKDGNPEEVPPFEDGFDTWKWHEGRGAYWASTNNEALVNLCSESAAAALSNAQCSWLKRGVSGVLLNPDFLREQRCGEQLVKKLVADAMTCVRSAGLETPVILVESSLNPLEAARYYGDGGIGANSVLSSALTTPNRSTPEMVLGFHASLLTAPLDAAPTWMTSTSTGSRIVTRYGSDMVDAINLLALTLPGSAVIQQGDELGAADTLLEWATSSTCWPYPPSPAKSPFPWDDGNNGGFSSGEPWLPLAPNYRYANAKAEFANDFSHVGVLRVAAALRKSPAFGPHVEIKRQNGAAIVLRWGSHGSLILVSNLCKDSTEVQLSRIPGIPAEMTVGASSTGSSYSVTSHLMMEKTLKLGPGETLLLAGGPRHCGGPGPVDKIANKLSEGWQKINKYFSNI
ncbi:maltase 1-like [Anticarsia gemmatalis]|uniref:maltase 1-like n=1 Tax=Anticarsia gemmatalis TaxID=129554 RepID=UPI003F75842D